MCKRSIDSLIKAENNAISKIDDEKLQKFLELFELQYTVIKNEINKLIGEKK